MPISQGMSREWSDNVSAIFSISCTVLLHQVSEFEVWWTRMTNLEDDNTSLTFLSHEKTDQRRILCLCQFEVL